MIIYAPLPLAGECLLCGQSRHLEYIDSDIGPVCDECAVDLYETEQRMIAFSSWGRPSEHSFLR